jgi:hypothetical protein
LFSILINIDKLLNMNQILRNGLFGFLLVGLVMGQSSAWAAQEEHFDYPELSVVPRASDRIQMEADKEDESRWTTFLPLQVSALATLGSGIASLQARDRSYGLSGVGVGAGWLAITTILSLSYRPYTSALNELPTKKGTVREQLTRERAAEEEIQRIASLGEKLKWISVLTELGASFYMLSSDDPSLTSSNSMISPKTIAAASAVLALTPLFFRFHWSEVRSQQAEYKKKIYGPVAGATLLQDPSTKQLTPGFSVSFRF